MMKALEKAKKQGCEHDGATLGGACLQCGKALQDPKGRVEYLRKMDVLYRGK